MTILEEAPTQSILGYGLYDADQHYYEPTDCVTRYLSREFRNAMRWVDIDGRKTVLINNKLLTTIPNPTYDPVGVPGSLEVYFRSENFEGRELREIVKMQAIQPEYRDRDVRIGVMDRQGVDFAWLLPSLGLSLEEMLCDDPVSLNAVFTSYNRWLDEDWGYDRSDHRLQVGPLISLVDPVWAEAEVDRVLAAGARFVTMRPAPVRSRGLSRHLGDPSHDRVWAKLAEAGCVVAIHAADSGYGRVLTDWGESSAYTGMKQSTFTEVVGVHIDRPIFDTMASFVCHGVFDRHPKLRVVTVELGAGWVPYLVQKMKKAYGKTPQIFGKDPVELFREHVWVAPFYEDEVRSLSEAIGEDRVLLGSDWPHPEGLDAPLSAVRDYEMLGEHAMKLALRDNMRELTGR